METLSTASSRLLERIGPLPRLAIILGSGLQDLAKQFPSIRSVDWKDLPGFLPPTVPGHQARFCVVQMGGIDILLMCGRLHFYEGFTMQQITFPVKVMARAGVSHLILTNASGAINLKFKPGDLMLLEDHLNFMGASPLKPERPGDAPCFLDQCGLYDKDLRQTLRQAARRTRIKLHQGVYVAVPGPSYETPAEIRAFRRLGADAVGMSTVPEAMVARAEGLKVAAIAILTNMAAGILQGSLCHEDVLRAGRASVQKMALLLETFVSLQHGVAPQEKGLRKQCQGLLSSHRK